MKYDIDEMIAEAKKNIKEGEVMVFALGTGRVSPMLGMVKKQKQALDIIKSLDGFIGINCVDLWHTLLIFDTLNHAKAGKNELKFQGIPVGNVAPILVREKDISTERSTGR